MTEPVSELSGEDRLVAVLQERVAQLTTADQQQRRAEGRALLSGARERQHGLSVIVEVVRAHVRDLVEAGQALPEASYDEHLIDLLYAQVYGAGQLQELLDDPDIENVDINGADEVWVTYADARGKQRHRPLAANDDDLTKLVRTLAAQGTNARPFTRAAPQLDLRLDDGSRLSAILRATERPVISIRRNRFPQLFLARVPDAATPTGNGNGETGGPRTLLELGAVDEQLSGFLQAVVLARHNLIIAGATDAGKTTLLRALIHCIPAAERLITVERALELGLRRHPELHPDVVEMEEVLPDADGHAGISIDELVRRTRRHNPSRVIVGEVLGPEVVQMLSAMSQGNDGSLSTIHARDAADVFHKLATYAAQWERLPFEVTHALIASSVDFVIFVRKNPLLGGRRCVSEVLEVTGVSDGQVVRSRIFAPSRDDGRAVRVSDVAIARGAELAASGYDDTDSAIGLYSVAAGWPVPNRAYGGNGVHGHG